MTTKDKILARFKATDLGTGNLTDRELLLANIAADICDNPIKSFRDITSHEKACQLLGKDPNESKTTDEQITDICNAINNLSGFVPDFNNNERYKYIPFFKFDASGFRFDGSGYGYSGSRAAVGSRLCHYVGSIEEANHLGTQFINLHKKHFYGEKP